MRGYFARDTARSQTPNNRKLAWRLRYESGGIHHRFTRHDDGRMLPAYSSHDGCSLSLRSGSEGRCGTCCGSRTRTTTTTCTSKMTGGSGCTIRCARTKVELVDLSTSGRAGNKVEKPGIGSENPRFVGLSGSCSLSVTEA